jgi:hypothetical protein
MLTAFIKNGGFGDEKIDWHVGENANNLRQLAEDCYKVQADGDELDEILRRCGATIPVSATTRVIRWYGDHAKFIVGNLPYKA